MSYVFYFLIKTMQDLFYVCAAIRAIGAKLRLGYQTTGEMTNCCRKFCIKNFSSYIIVSFMLEFIIG